MWYKAMTDTSEWAGNSSGESGPCPPDIDLLSQEMAKVHRDKDRRHVAVIMQMQAKIQLPQQSVKG